MQSTSNRGATCIEESDEDGDDEDDDDDGPPPNPVRVGGQFCTEAV